MRPHASSACCAIACTAAKSVTEASLAIAAPHGGADLLGDRRCAGAEVVDDDPGAAAREREGMLAAEAAAGSGDDGHAAAEVDLLHELDRVDCRGAPS